MTDAFFKHPILNSPYEYPGRHWELDEFGQPTQKIIEARRKVSLVTPIPKPKKRTAKQHELALDEGRGLSSEKQKYDLTSIINEVRGAVDTWRRLPESQWRVTPETARLLRHWRHHAYSGVRPFFCQVEAAETAIWLTEVAPHAGKSAATLLGHLQAANEEANPELQRLALKLATGAGKTTVMAMLIAWQTINAVRRPSSRQFTRGFLVVTPGLTIKDRLQVLLPSDPNSYYANRELVPHDLIEDVKRAKIVITNYHAFKLRETLELSAGGRALLRGRTGDELQTTETEGQMIQRVMPDLMGMKQIMVINDEAHHCYREKPPEEDDEELKGEAREEAERNNKNARVWISGLEAVKRKLGVQRVLDLSATPFFLAGSGYNEGSLFPWTMSDFSLMDAIECGIVKLPRVPVAQNTTSTDEMPYYRNLWEHVGKALPRKGRGKGGDYDPEQLPALLQTALESLYGHYQQTFDLWQQAGISVPPCFIIVCQNTAISKLVYDFVSGYEKQDEHGNRRAIPGRLKLFSNYDESTLEPLPYPNTLLIDSEQLEAGDALDDRFRAIAADEIDRFRRELIERTGDRNAADNITDQHLLRAVMNTVGKAGELGAGIRCVVSVSMLTEGWDANNVTHILGIRAFGTQLLCEQVVGRALRRQSYELNEDGRFNTEYADIFGVPFDFTAKPVVAPPQPPRETVQVRALRPERDHLEIRFPRVQGYRVELPQTQLRATFSESSKLVLTPELVGPTITTNAGIIGEQADLGLQHLDVRQSTLLFELTKHLLYTKWRDPGDDPQLHLFGQLKRITREWLDTCLTCKGDTYPGLLKYKVLADEACNRITAAISTAMADTHPIRAVLDPFNPIGSTAHVRFNTSRALRWDTRGPPPKSHVNWVICDSQWEAEFCRVVEAHPKVLAYARNQNLGLEVPYQFGSSTRRYLPDFVLLVDDGHGAADPLHVVVEIKGYRREDAKAKKEAMNAYWIPGVNNLKSHGRWAFAEFQDVYTLTEDLAHALAAEVDRVLATAGR